MKFYATFKGVEGKFCYSFSEKKLRDFFVEMSNVYFGMNTSEALSRTEAMKRFGYTDSCSNRVIRIKIHFTGESPIIQYLKDWKKTYDERARSEVAGNEAG